MPERELRQRIRAALKRAFPGALVLQWPSNMWTGPGWPDLLYSEWPLLVGFEVKYGRKSKPTPIQRSRHVELRSHHVPVYVVYTPDDAVGTIHTLKEKLPMAFDPDLLAELDAALSEPTPEVAAPEVETNGTAPLEELPVFEEVTLDAEAPAPDIEDLTAAIVTNTELQVAETEAVLAVEGAQVEILVMLKESIDTLTDAINKLRIDLNADIEDDDKHLVPQTAEAPAPRRRNSRRG